MRALVPSIGGCDNKGARQFALDVEGPALLVCNVLTAQRAFKRISKIDAQPGSVALRGGKTGGEWITELITGERCNSVGLGIDRGGGADSTGSTRKLLPGRCGMMED